MKIKTQTKLRRPVAPRKPNRPMEPRLVSPKARISNEALELDRYKLFDIYMNKLPRKKKPDGLSLDTIIALLEDIDNLKLAEEFK